MKKAKMRTVKLWAVVDKKSGKLLTIVWRHIHGVNFAGPTARMVRVKIVEVVPAIRRTWCSVCDGCGSIWPKGQRSPCKVCDGTGTRSISRKGYERRHLPKGNA